MAKKKKKFRKFRGKRTYGSGSHKKRRGAGSRGGRGKAGLHKHKWTYTVKYAPEHFGRRGFKRPPTVIKKLRTINLKELDQLAEKLIKKKLVEEVEGKIKINLPKIGYEKVLGSGKLTKPLIIEAKNFSDKAIKKIEEAKGKAVKV
jgi:large subunit ribosomal protein L15